MRVTLCNRCKQEVIVVTGDCFLGERPAKHNKPDGAECRLEVTFTSMTFPDVKVPFPPFPK